MDSMPYRITTRYDYFYRTADVPMLEIRRWLRDNVGPPCEDWMITYHNNKLAVKAWLRWT